jgi:hypothetical protein
MHIEESLIVEAASAAVRLGSHRVKNRGGVELFHHRTFWVVYILDRTFAFFNGRSPVRSGPVAESLIVLTDPLGLGRLRHRMPHPGHAGGKYAGH